MVGIVNVLLDYPLDQEFLLKLYQEYNKEKAKESKEAEEIKEKGGDEDETD